MNFKKASRYPPNLLPLHFGCHLHMRTHRQSVWRLKNNKNPPSDERGGELGEPTKIGILWSQFRGRDWWIFDIYLKSTISSIIPSDWISLTSISDGWGVTAYFLSLHPNAIYFFLSISDKYTVSHTWKCFAWIRIYEFLHFFTLGFLLFYKVSQTFWFLYSPFSGAEAYAHQRKFLLLSGFEPGTSVTLTTTPQKATAYKYVATEQCSAYSKLYEKKKKKLTVFISIKTYKYRKKFAT